jgi:hypothetical protein
MDHGQLLRSADLLRHLWVLHLVKCAGDAHLAYFENVRVLFGQLACLGTWTK